MTSLLSASDLCLIRGDLCLFEGLSFALNPGELLHVEGTNGSGKTSLLRAVAGLLEFDEGSIEWRGSPVRRQPQAFRASMAWFGHRTGLKADLTAVENLRFESGLRAAGAHNIDVALERVRASKFAGLPVRAMSAGQQRRIALARLLLADVPFWLLDEPLTNLDTAGQRLVRGLLESHLDAGGIALVASHQALELTRPVSRIAL